MEAPDDLSISVLFRDGFQIVVVRGELDEVTAPSLEALLNDDHNGRTVIVDLSPLEFMSSAGIHVLFRERATTTAVVAPPSSIAARILDLVRLARANRSVLIFGSLDDAIQRLSFRQAAS